MIIIKQIDFLTDKIIAHRGVFDNQKGIPENTLLAFEKAIEKGYPIELDVHLLKDGNIVVFHDNNLKRMTGIDKAIKECKYEELQELNLLNTKIKIPTIQQVIACVKGKVALLIELKQDNTIGKLEQELATILDNYTGKFAVQSFNPFSVYWFKKNRATYVRGQLVTMDATKNKIVDAILKNQLLNPLTNPDFISCNIEMLPNRILEEQSKKRVLIGWTVSSKKQYEYYKPYCDSLICETFR